MPGRLRIIMIVAAAAVASAACAAPLPDPLPCTACFIGELGLKLNDADPSGRTMVLQDDFYFVDPGKLVWKADRGDITDGASIPEIFKPVVGGSFEKDFLPAAVLHDHYTTKEHYVRTWNATALMFYQAMVVRQVPAIKAKTMYYAVYAFGPHWGFVAAGRDCGKNCVNAAPDPARPNLRFVRRSSDYDRPGNASELAIVQGSIARSELEGRPLSIEDLNKLARLAHVNDAFIDPAPLPNDR